MIIVQSYIDLITNSSTSVFQWANSVSGVKDIINAILKSAGSDLKCDDLFDITIHYNIDIGDTDDYYYSLAKEKAESTPGKYPELEQLLEKYNNCTEYKKVDELENQIYDYLVKYCGAKTLDEYAKDYNNNNDDWMYSSSYIIEAKDPKNKEYEKALYTINNLFDYDARYC